MQHKKKLPALEHPPGGNMKPARTRNIFELWIAEIAVGIGTWGHDAQEYWMKTVQQARMEHAD
eukprot:12886318-Prorocentrum_lima.AAC.1